MSILVEGIILRSVVSNDELVGSLLLLKLSAGDGFGWWSRFLQYPLDNGVTSSSTSVVHFLSIFEEEEGWEALDAEFLSEFLLFGCVNLGNGEWWVVFGQDFCGGSVLWGKFLAVATPWGIKFNEQEFMIFELFVKVVVSENEYTFFFGNFGQDVLDSQGSECE